MFFKKNKREERDISKVKSAIENKLSIFADNSLEIDNDYLKMFQNQYRVYVYAYVKIISNQRIRIITSYEYFMADYFEMIFEVAKRENELINAEMPPVIEQMQAEYNTRIGEAKNTYEKVDIAFDVLSANLGIFFK